METPKKVDGIILSQERHNELLEKEIRADNNTITLKFPEKLRHYSGCYDWDIERFYVEGYNNQNKLLSRVDEIIRPFRESAKWYESQKDIKQGMIENLENLRRELLSKENQLKTLDKITKSWWYKLFFNYENAQTGI